MTPVAAYTLCALLIAVDLVARAGRFFLFARGAGHPVAFRDIFVLNVFGDAAAAVTPLRIGGEPARLAGLMHAGLSAGAGVAILAVEAASYYAVVLLIALWLAVGLAPEWWASVGPGLLGSVRGSLPWLGVLVALSGVAVWTVRRGAASHGKAGRALREMVHDVRSASRWPLLLSAPLTLVSVGSRMAVLPILAQTLPDPPPLPVLAMGSFALLYGQLFIPIPAGAGAVELAVAGGAAGEMGAGVASVLFAWRVFTLGIGLVLGLALGLPRYGWSAVRGVLGWKGKKE
ncbi:MAG: flippase-like domain-containing protein [Gemmatimonadota bacterium]|nr:flippase-like domain-containing protein [Gemmatimonadota bacterium]